MDGKIKRIINIVVVVAVVLWILGMFVGGWGGIGNIQIGRSR
jgi:hypothetical protein